MYWPDLLNFKFQVNDKKAIQVEIQRSASDSSLKKTSAKRVERKHLKVNKDSLTELLILNEAQ